MILEAIVTVAVPLGVAGLVKAIQVDQKVKTQDEDIKYIRSRVDKILDHLLDHK